MVLGLKTIVKFGGTACALALDVKPIAIIPATNKTPKGRENALKEE